MKTEDLGSNLILMLNGVNFSKENTILGFVSGLITEEVRE